MIQLQVGRSGPIISSTLSPMEFPAMVRVLAVTTCLLYLFQPSVLMANDGGELVPFVGYRFGGSFDDEISRASLDVDEQGSWGFAISIPASSTTRHEFIYSHQDTSLMDRGNPEDAFDLEIHYLHLGGSLDVSHDYFITFLSGGVGLTHMSPGRSGFSNETRLSVSLGGGLKWYLTDQLGIRLELRGYGTLLDTSGSLFCDGGCELELSSDLFPQFETNLGLIFRF